MTEFEPKVLAFADDLLDTALAAQAAMLAWDQAMADRVVEACARAAFEARHDLATRAFEETQMGFRNHKVVKNAWASLLVHRHLRDLKTVGPVRVDSSRGIEEWAFPRGPVLAITPVTNPTSTAIHNVLIAMKARCPIILSPHRRAKGCVAETVRIMGEAAIAAGAPDGCVQIIKKAMAEYTHAVMQHRKLALILATGAGNIVRTAQQAGRPCIGVGPGNVPCYVHESADLDGAARYIVHSKTWDNGTVCASEQTLIVTPATWTKLLPQLVERGCHLCTPEQVRALEPLAFDAESRGMKAEIVGQPAVEIARRAGFEGALAAPTERGPVRCLLAPIDGIGHDWPLSVEILAPILAVRVVDDHMTALATCRDVLQLGGRGHTLVVHTQDDTVIEEIASSHPAGRICVNSPGTQAAIGGTHNALAPSLSIGCGSGGGNIHLANISVEHLLEIRTVARLSINLDWHIIGAAKLLDESLGFDAAKQP